jgi:hypothetical protein
MAHFKVAYAPDFLRNNRIMAHILGNKKWEWCQEQLGHGVTRKDGPTEEGTRESGEQNKNIQKDRKYIDHADN